MADPWRISLHGGHSGEFCEHAEGSLRSIVEAAIAVGYQSFGISEHAPRHEERFLYNSERDKGYTTERLESEFDAYVTEAKSLAVEFADRIELLVGWESEVIPTDACVDEALLLREKYQLDYQVGSVHHVGEVPLDGDRADFERIVEESGGLEQAAVRYYDAVAEMAGRMRPEIIGHLDLIRRHAPPDADLSTPPIQAAALRALESVAAAGSILDVNTAGWRKGLGNPYPEPWLVERANAMGIGFCFGDDSHKVAQVGNGIDQARTYLLAWGVNSIRALRRDENGIKMVAVPLS